jgi:hypothetical protein
MRAHEVNSRLKKKKKALSLKLVEKRTRPPIRILFMDNDAGKSPLNALLVGDISF